MTTTLVTDLNRWCLLANEVSNDMYGARNTCIQTSLALAEFLRRQGLQAEVFRATAKAFCDTHDWCHGCSVGSDGDGTRRPRSAGWVGHLAVSCGDYVLDPTLDQLKVGCGLRPHATVFRKPPGWGVTPPDRPWQGGAWFDWREDGLQLAHVRHARQMGWKSKPVARPGYWMNLVADMLLTHNDEDR